MDGEPIPGAEIYVELEPDDEPIAHGTTNGNGEFTFQVLERSDTTRPFPREGTFAFVVKPPRELSTPSQKSVRLRAPFTRTKATRAFTYVLLWIKPDAKAQTKGAFAISGKSST